MPVDQNPMTPDAAARVAADAAGADDLTLSANDETAATYSGELGVRVETSGLSEVETAAAIAVVGSVLEAEPHELRSTPPAGQSAWERSQRGLRAPLTTGPGRWRSFG